MAEPVRVLLADDHPLVRSGICTTLRAAPDLTLVGEASDGHATHHLNQALQPDVLLLDLTMPGPPPAQTMAYLRAHCLQVQVLVLNSTSSISSRPWLPEHR